MEGMGSDLRMMARHACGVAVSVVEGEVLGRFLSVERFSRSFQAESASRAQCVGRDGRLSLRETFIRRSQAGSHKNKC